MTTDTNPQKADREREHGRFLADGDTELLWGWGTPAGRERALRRAKLISEAAELGPDKRILEIGCGTGMFTEMFAETGANIVAVDISADLLEKAGERGLPADRVKFMCQAFEDSHPQGPFDAVIGSSVLHHLEIEVSIGQIYQLLKPNGILAFAEPNMLNPQIFAERTFLRNYLPRISPDETAFIRWSFAEILRKAGFNNICLTPFDWLHPSTPKPLIGIVSAMCSIVEEIPIMKEFAGSLLMPAVRSSE